MPALIGYAAAAFVGLGVAMFAIALSRRTSTGVERLARVGVGSATTTTSEAGDRGHSLASRLMTAFQTKVGHRRELSVEQADRVRQRLDRAGLAMPAEALLALKVGGLGLGLLVGLGGALALGLDLPIALAAIVLGGVTGYLSPDLWVLQTAQRRQQQIDRSIPETLDLLALTAQAGLGLEQGIGEVANELPGALGAELDRFLKEQQLGLSRQAALQGLIDRNGSEDLRSFALALMQADQLGTPIAKTLQVQAREMRRRRRARAREQAGKAPVKLLFPLIFGIFPALFIIVMGPGALAIIDAFTKH